LATYPYSKYLSQPSLSDGLPDFHPRDIPLSVTGSINSLVLVHLIKLQAGRVSDTRVDRIISLNSLVLSHPRRGNAGHRSHLRHWNCWMHTLNGTHIPQVRRHKGPNNVLIKCRILKPLQPNNLVWCISKWCQAESELEHNFQNVKLIPTKNFTPEIN
jgi:hypothetical protein